MVVKFGSKPFAGVVECTFAFAAIVPKRVIVSEVPLDGVYYDACPVRASEVYRDV